MAGLSAPGLGSGLDVQGIVSQLMAIERQPLRRIQQRQKEYEAQLSSYGKVKSAISSLRDSMAKLASLDKFEVYSATSSNENAFTASASTAASSGTFDIKVVNLAEAQKLRSAGFTDAQNDFGQGSLTIDVGGDAFSVTIDGSNNTLEGIRTAINSASDNTGVTASIVSDGTNKYLTLTANETGAANTITVTAVDDGSGASTLVSLENASLTELQAAQDATIYIDGDPPSLGGNGIEVTSASNTVTGVIEGITLELKSVTTDFETLDVSRDTAAVKESIQSFVDSYNSIRSTISSLREKELSGDNTLLSIESQLRSVLNSPPNGLTGSFTYLSEIGIKTERDGTLSLDTSDLDAALESDFSGVAELFANDDQGYAYRMKALADQMLDYDGIIDAKEDSLNTSIDGLEDQQAQWEYRLEQIEARYLKEFTALDATLSQMQSTSSYLTQQLAGLPTPG